MGYGMGMYPQYGFAQIVNDLSAAGTDIYNAVTDNQPGYVSTGGVSPNTYANPFNTMPYGGTFTSYGTYVPPGSVAINPAYSATPTLFDTTNSSIFGNNSVIGIGVLLLIALLLFKVL